jgi:hypothetical protein
LLLWDQWELRWLVLSAQPFAKLSVTSHHPFPFGGNGHPHPCSDRTAHIRLQVYASEPQQRSDQAPLLSWDVSAVRARFRRDSVSGTQPLALSQARACLSRCANVEASARLVRFGLVPLDITPEADGAIGLAAAPAVSAGVPLRAEHAFCVVRFAPQALRPYSA